MEMVQSQVIIISVMSKNIFHLLHAIIDYDVVNLTAFVYGSSTIINAQMPNARFG